MCCAGIDIRTRLILTFVGAASILAGQSPDGLVRINVTMADGSPVAGASVVLADPALDVRASGMTNSGGEVVFAALPVGTYTVTVSGPSLGAVPGTTVNVSVASRQEKTIVVQRPDQDRGRADTATGLTRMLENPPPTPVIKADTIAASVSVLFQEQHTLNLPLVSRNLYSLFLLQPGVTSAGANLRRGLTFSVHGQRVSASNYLMDGVDNNNLRLSGPAVVNSLESVSELRMVNSSFSADSGRATGFIAHVNTARGVSKWRGAFFAYLGHDALNATPSAANALGEIEPPFRHAQIGGSVSGRVRPHLFTSSTVEVSRLSYGLDFGNEFALRVPTSAFIQSVPPSNPLAALFAATPPVPVTAGPSDPRYGDFEGTVSGPINSIFATQRVDRVLRDGSDRLIGRFAFAHTDQRLPSDFGGYPDLWPQDTFGAHNALAGWTKSWTPGLVNDLRAGWSREGITRDRPFGDRPTIRIAAPSVRMPSENRLMGEHGNTNVVQIADILTLRRGRSTVSAGFDARRSFDNGVNGGIESGAFTAFNIPVAGLYLFSTLADATAGRVAQYALAIDALSPQPKVADLSRAYRATDFSAFIQHDSKLSRFLSVNMGLRWDYFGVIHDVDPTTDYNFYFGAGSTPQERLGNGSLRSAAQNSGDLHNRIYRPDYLNLAPSFGIAWDPFGTGKTVVRAGYGIGYDRIFNAARDVRQNRSRNITCALTNCAGLILSPTEALASIRPTFGRPSQVIVDENLRTPYAQNWYFGVQRNLTNDIVFEIGHAGSAGRRLLSRDQVNRPQLGFAPSGTANDTFISNQGSSTYLGMELAIRGRVRRGPSWQFAYTWSHAIDNQSDILEGFRVGPEISESVVATFTRQLDPRVDRGSANFDQRHNLVFSGIWEIPAVPGKFRRGTSGWTLSTIAGYHSGFPITVATTAATGAIRNNRPDLIQPLSSAHETVPGGVRWFRADNFAVPANRVGTLGRNAIAGPGAWNCDLAVLKALPILNERLRAQLRFEAYNVFNHANLSIPVSLIGAADFGIAYAGRSRSYYSRFGELPLDSPSRRIQVAIRLHF
jgi:hypothetical protein